MHTNLTSGLDSLQSTDLDAGQVFSGKPSGTTVRGYAVTSAYAPALDHEYIFHESSRDMVVWFVSPQGGTRTAVRLRPHGLRQNKLHQTTGSQAQLSGLGGDRTRKAGVRRSGGTSDSQGRQHDL